MATKRTATQEKSVGKSTRTKEPDLFSLLKEDHDKVKDLFEQIVDGEGESENIFSEIREELETHMEGEEKFFYPALEESDETREKVFESYEEHHVTKNVLGEFDGMGEDGDRWKAKVKVLKELVEHHIQEEEKEVFKLAKKALDKEQLQEIAGQIMENKSEA